MDGPTDHEVEPGSLHRVRHQKRVQPVVREVHWAGVPCRRVLRFPPVLFSDSRRPETTKGLRVVVQRLLLNPPEHRCVHSQWPTRALRQLQVVSEPYVFRNCAYRMQGLIVALEPLPIC